MGQRSPRERALEWLRENPKASAAEAARKFGVGERTVQKWAKGAGLSRSAPTPGRPTPTPSRARGAPAEELPEDDRERAVQIVRDSRFVLAHTVAHLRKLVEADPSAGLALDRDAAQALLNLERTARDVIDSHPGLLKLVRDEAGAEAADGVDLSPLDKALGLDKG